MTEPTAVIRDQLFSNFQEWLQMEETDAPPIAELARRDPIQLVTWLGEFGRFLYEGGETRRNFAETANVLTQRFPFLRTFMAGPGIF